MDQRQKLEYQKQVEKYLEENNIHDLFERLFRDLIIERPDHPIEYLIKKLTQPPKQRIFICAPTYKKSLVTALSKEMGLSLIQTGEVLMKAGHSPQQLGSDHQVIQIILQEIQKLEKTPQSQGWILEGFPKNMIQGLALQKNGIIPDKFIIVEGTREKICPRLKQKLKERFPKDSQEDIEDKVEYYLTEYDLNVKGVKQLYSEFCNTVQLKGSLEETKKEVMKMLRQGQRTNAPRKPPRVVVVGPPGSGRTTQGKMLADQYGLVFISVTQLLKNEIYNKSPLGGSVAGYMNEGEDVPDEIVLSLIDQRLKAGDAKVKGFVLEGFPRNTEQMRLLDLKPTLVVMLECEDDLSYKRLNQRALDPLTGIYYNTESEEISEEILARLYKPAEDSHGSVKKRLESWKKVKSDIEKNWSRWVIKVSSDGSQNQIQEVVQDALENPVS